MFIAPEDTGFGIYCQPNSVAHLNYRSRMAEKSIAEIIWENVSALMKQRYGREFLAGVAKDAKIGPTTMTRIKERQPSTGAKTISAIAKAWGLEPWQLLVEDLDPIHPPKIETENAWPFPGIEPERFEHLTDTQKIEIQGVIRKMILDFEDAANKQRTATDVTKNNGKGVQTTTEDQKQLDQTGEHGKSTAFSGSQKSTLGTRKKA
ncbi:hypothetical protein D9M73_90660 [compost metagenome]|nr:MAG TPA: SOS-response transcriptional repressor [Caudoviricetes sp.]